MHKLMFIPKESRKEFQTRTWESHLKEDGPNYGEVAKAAANGHLWTKKVTKAADLEATLIEATRMVKEQKMSAVVDVVISLR